MIDDAVRSALVIAIALRLFTPDLCALARWLLGTGVRVGAASLAEQHHHRRHARTATLLPPHPASDERGQA